MGLELELIEAVRLRSIANDAGLQDEVDRHDREIDEILRTLAAISMTASADVVA